MTSLLFGNGAPMKQMRRQDRALSAEETTALLDMGEYGVLSTVDQVGQPYGVPLSYVYKNDAIYFHSALTGHKLDNIEDNVKVSFCVVGKTHVLQEKFSTEYESAILFGTASEVVGAEKRNALIWLLEKYCPDFMTEGRVYLNKAEETTQVIKIQVARVSGKARR